MAYNVKDLQTKYKEAYNHDFNKYPLKIFQNTTIKIHVPEINIFYIYTHVKKSFTPERKWAQNTALILQNLSKNNV